MKSCRLKTNFSIQKPVPRRDIDDSNDFMELGEISSISELNKRENNCFGVLKKGNRILTKKYDRYV